MAPAFQGIINKWVKINKYQSELDHHPSGEIKASSDLYGSKAFGYPRRKHGEDYSIKTADETATFDSSPNSRYKPSIIKLESSKVATKSSSSFSTRKTSKKLSHSNSYTDLLRKKRADAIPIEQEYEKEPEVYNYEQPLGVSVEELFNPLATHSTHLYYGDSLKENAACNRRHSCSDNRMGADTLDSCKQHSALHRSLEGCRKCAEVKAKVQEMIHSSEYIRSRKDGACGICRKTVDDAVRELASISADDDPSCVPDVPAKTTSISSSVPIQICKPGPSPDYQVGDSIALIESSQRLFDFMNLHKTRINQLKQEQESKQKKLNAKLSEFSVMCQMIRNEMSKTRDESVSKNAVSMILELEAEINTLQSQQISTNVPEGISCSIHEDTEIIDTEPMVETTSNIHYIRNISHGNLTSLESDVTSCLSETDASHTSQELVFSLDDEF